MTDSAYQLGDHITLKELTRAIDNGFFPIVQVESTDGIYTVRLHHPDGVSVLSDAQGKTRIFQGTGEIRDQLGDIGLTHGVLTWADQCGDEMIGVSGKAITPDEMLAYGTRISFR